MKDCELFVWLTGKQLKVSRSLIAYNMLGCLNVKESIKWDTTKQIHLSKHGERGFIGCSKSILNIIFRASLLTLVQPIQKNEQFMVILTENQVWKAHISTHLFGHTSRFYGMDAWWRIHYRVFKECIWGQTFKKTLCVFFFRRTLASISQDKFLQHQSHFIVTRPDHYIAWKRVRVRSHVL